MSIADQLVVGLVIVAVATVAVTVFTQTVIRVIDQVITKLAETDRFARERNEARMRLAPLKQENAVLRQKLADLALRRRLENLEGGEMDSICIYPRCRRTGSVENDSLV